MYLYKQCISKDRKSMLKEMPAASASSADASLRTIIHPCATKSIFGLSKEQPSASAPTTIAFSLLFRIWGIDTVPPQQGGAMFARPASATTFS